MAEIVEMHRKSWQIVEQSPRHRCLQRSTTALLRMHLQRPELLAQLDKAGFTHPFPADCQS